MRDRAPRRGQAVTEMVLGMLVALTVAFGLLSFAELGYARLKLQEAQYSAAWEAPAKQAHDLLRAPAPGVPRRDWRKLHETDALSEVSARESSRYAQLRGVQNEQSPDLFVRIDGVRVRCAFADRRPFQPSPAQLGAVDALYTPAGDAAQCSAGADVHLAGVPDLRLSIFGEPIIARTSLSLCARRDGAGPCARGAPILTDTWAFSGRTENLSCRVVGCDNPAVRELAEAALTGLGPVPTGAVMSMAKHLGVPVPDPAPNASFAGSETAFLDGVSPAHGCDTWSTTPFHPDHEQLSYARRKPGYPGFELSSPGAFVDP
jgi:hypothetical protein